MLSQWHNGVEQSGDRTQFDLKVGRMWVWITKVAHPEGPEQQQLIFILDGRIFLRTWSWHFTVTKWLSMYLKKTVFGATQSQFYSWGLDEPFSSKLQQSLSDQDYTQVTIIGRLLRKSIMSSTGQSVQNFASLWSALARTSSPMPTFLNSGHIALSLSVLEALNSTKCEKICKKSYSKNTISIMNMQLNSPKDPIRL